MADIFIGTSGWQYDSWKNRFYPAKLPLRDELEYYSHEFHTVEIDYSFYKLPKVTEYEHWKKKYRGASSSR